jgi:hypothetical protein
MPATVTVARTDLSQGGGHVSAVIALQPRADRGVVLVELADAVTGVTPVPVAASGPAAGDTLQTAGYGRTSTVWVPDRMQTASFSVQETGATTLSMTGSAPETSLCKGDAGGPLLRDTGGQPSLVAVNTASWQHGCLGANETRQGATGTRVDGLAGWIESFTACTSTASDSPAHTASTAATRAGTTAGTLTVATTTPTHQLTHTVQPARDPARSGAAPALAQATFANGTFIRDNTNGTVYRIIGGAPVYVSSWGAVGGEQATVSASPATIAALPATPADGALVGAAGWIWVFAGGAPLPVADWAHIGGPKPYFAIDNAAIVNAGGGGIWNHVRPIPRDGTFVGASGSIYVFAGGAPYWVGDWAHVGGPKPYTSVDEVAIDNASGGGLWDHVRALPTDGTLVAAGGSIYVFAGGTPFWVTNWANIGGPQPYTPIDQLIIDNIGGAGVWSHTRTTPTDGTIINGSGTIYVFAGGAPLPVADWAHVGGPKPYTVIDQVILNNIGGDGVWSHIRATPADGTIVTAAGITYVLAGGAPLPVTDWSHIGGLKPSTVIDQFVIDYAGGEGIWSRVHATPADGTFLRAFQSNDIYRVVGGAPVFVSGWAALNPDGTPFPSTDIDGVDVEKAGCGTVYNHLRYAPADGTLVTGSPGGARYLITDGQPVPYTGTDAIPATNTIDQYAIDHAGEPGRLSHLMR